MRIGGSHVGFPAVAFASHAEFVAYCTASRSLLDARYTHERSLALAPGEHVRPGTCAPCLRQTRFSLSTEHGEKLPNGRVVPNWREQLLCDCADRLTNRQRALLHFVESTIGAPSWSRVLALGRLSAAERRLCQRLGTPIFVPRLPSLRLDLPDASCQLAVTLDYIHQIRPLAAMLAEIRRVLAPGGALVFTVPFRWDRMQTRSHVDPLAVAAGPVESPREVHEIGWDILDLLRAAGFARNRVHSYWSEELGYLGPFNTLFSAET
jgi:SAM-dependent methyltransferase